MKIAILSTIENCTWAGTEEVWAQFAIHAMDNGHEVILLAHHKIGQSEQVASLKKRGLKVLCRKPFRPVKAYLFKELLYSDYRDFYRFKTDVILINSGSMYDATNLPYLYNFLVKQSVPKIFFCHFAAETFRQSLSIQFIDFFKSMEQVIFVSKHNMELAERQSALKFNKATVIMNQSKVFMNEPMEWPHDAIIQLACVARLETSWKGQDVLLSILASDIWRERNWHLNLYGEGQDRVYIDRLIQFYGIEHRVTIHGYVKDVRTIWEKCHIKVMASRGEGTPLSVIEAMMCGRPSVVTDVGGNREIVEEGKSGWIAESATSYSFANALERAWNSIDQWKDMGYFAHGQAKKMSVNNAPGLLLDACRKIVSQIN